MRAYPFRRDPAIRSSFAVAANDESTPGSLLSRSTVWRGRPDCSVI
jgi:hypothetical protein